MSYDYQIERPKVLTPEVSAQMMRCWESLRPLVQTTGAITGGKALEHVHRHTDIHDTWTGMAVIERLAEVGLLVCLVGGTTCHSWQERIYVPGEVVR